MRLVAGMDRETEASAKSQARKDIFRAEDLECEAIPTQRVDKTRKKGKDSKANRKEEKQQKGQGFKADRKLPQATACNTGSKPSREERSVAASLRLFAGMDRETEASAKRQQRKDIRHLEDLECEARLVRDLIANTHTIDSDKREALTEEMEER